MANSSINAIPTLPTSPAKHFALPLGLKLKNEKSLVGQINIAKALLANNPNQLLTVCEKEVNNLSPEEFPFSIIAGAKEKATPLQINRWKKIGQKLVAKCEDKDMAKQMEQ